MYLSKIKKIVNITRFYSGNVFRFLSIPFNQITISPSEARTIFASSFEKSGWHHIIKTLEEYDLNPNINYKDTTLYLFLKYFRPKSICDLISNIENQNKLPLFVYPWGTFKKNEYDTKKDPKKSRFCGPSNDVYIKNHFDHIINLYKSIKIHGYKPWSRGNGFIGGTILIKKNGDRRFVVLQGNHRMAILSHLNYKLISVRNIKGYLKKVKEEDLNKFPLVSNRSCSKKTARNIFFLFFEEQGKHLLKHIKK